MRQRNGGTDSRHRLSNMDSQALDPGICSSKEWKNPWSARCLTGGGTETFDSIMTTSFWSMGCWQFPVQGSSVRRCQMEKLCHGYKQNSKADQA